MVVKFHNMKYVPLLLFQFILMALYFVFTKYDGDHHHDVRGFEDTHVMIFIGFGFLMTFLKKYCYTALGYNWLLAALSVQWALLCQSFYHMKDNVILINKETLVEADIMTATVLITFGSVLGIASSAQLLLVAIIEVAVGCFNFWLVADKFQAADVGGSIAIHAFGAYFGLGLSWALHFKKKDPPPPPPPTTSSFSPFNLSQSTSAAPAVNLNLPSYNSDVTAMIGSIFLFIYWPSFNSALTKTNEEYQRAVINSYLSLASATVTTFVMSSLVSHHKGKLDMVHIQNSTLAGGVAVGSVCNMHISAGGAIAVGIGAGFLSVLGYRFLTPALTKIGIHDTCGVNNLHGMPGIYSGILTAVFAMMATKEQYKEELDNIFPAMKGETGISAIQQGINQILAVLVTIAVGIVGGAVTGFITRFVKPLKKEQKYNDEMDWELP